MTRSDESPHNPTPRELICHAGAGAAAGAIAATFVCPLDVIKTRLQVYGLPATPNSGRAGGIIITSLKNIVKTEGFKGLYRGLSPTIIALLPNWAVYFATYEHLKGLLLSHGVGNGQLTVGANMLAAAGAGAATAIATNPLWVVKTRLQIYFSMLQKYLSQVTTGNWGWNSEDQTPYSLREPSRHLVGTIKISLLASRCKGS